jgi:hypothetical protein
MAINLTPWLQDLRNDFERLLDLVSGPGAQTATLDQMERSIFRHVLQLGRKLLALFLAGRTQAESHAPQWSWQRQRVPYHGQKGTDYFSIFGKLRFDRAYFYTLGLKGKYPLDRALSLPERCYSDLLLECAEVLAVEGAYDKAVAVLARLLGVELSELAVETAVMQQSQAVLPFYAQQAAPLPRDEGRLLVAQADGKGVPIIHPDEAASKKVRRGKGDKKSRKKGHCSFMTGSKSDRVQHGRGGEVAGS